MLLSLMAALMALIVGLFLWDSVKTHSVQVIRSHLEYWQPILTGIRWGLIAGVALAWPRLCRWWVTSGDLRNHKARQLSDLRWRIVGWLAVIELILGQGVLVRAMALISGTPG